MCEVPWRCNNHPITAYVSLEWSVDVVFEWMLYAVAELATSAVGPGSWRWLLGLLAVATVVAWVVVFW